MRRMLSGATLLLATVSFDALSQMPDDPRYYDRDSSTIYLEQVTPPGRVPPAANSSSVTGLPQPAPVAAPIQQRASQQTAQFDSGPFVVAYQRVGSPRVVVYFNRYLSDEVREVLMSDRFVVEKRLSTSSNISASVSSVGTGLADLNPRNLPSAIDGDDSVKRVTDGTVRSTLSSRDSSKISTDSMIVSQDTSYSVGGTGVQGIRADPIERWMWEFESLVVGRLVNLGVRSVDRSIILRRQAMENPQKGGYGDLLSTNLNEMGALDEYGDILVELAVVPDPSSAVGYNIKAIAKGIKSGQVYGSSFVSGINNNNPIYERFVAGDSGFIKVTEQAPISFADVVDDLMDPLLGLMAKSL